MSRPNTRNQQSSIPKCILKLELFQPNVLKDLGEDAVDVALLSVRPFVQLDTFKFVLQVALERQGCLEFLFSSLPQDQFNFVLKWVNETFPHDLDNYSSESLCIRLLSAISISLQLFPYVNDDFRPPDLASSHEYVVNSNTVLQALASVTQRSVPEIEERSSKMSQKARKNVTRSQQAPRFVDVAPFRALHLELPPSPQKGREMALEILAKQKGILMSYLNVFRLEFLTDAFKGNYIPSVSFEATVDDMSALPANPSDETIEMSEDVTTVYPQVQPLRAALYFDSAKGFGQWRIWISSRAVRNLREAKKKDTNLFRITLKKIKELSHGHFSEDNQKRLIGTSTPVPIYEAKTTRDSRLVYQVDCIQGYDNQVECQAIRVFGIYTHAQLDKRLWNSIGYQLSGKGREYQRRCTFRADPMHKGDKVVPPASFPAALPPDPNMIPDELPTVKPPTVSEEVLEELHAILVLEKFVAFSQTLLTSIIADQDFVHMFQLSPHEQEIIEHTHSCLVQGRSGTGKTTTMLFKMLSIEHSWQQNRELRPERPRQLFVTQSRMLADKVEEYFIKLLQTLVLESQTERGISDLLERQKNREEAGLVDQEEALDWREDLPRRFSELQDSHFPMFLTFDKLSAMIEADISHPLGISSDESLSLRVNNEAVSSEYMMRRWRSFISFDVFRENYWGHFPQHLTKGLDVSLVFSEFMGVIKGSERTLTSKNHVLDHDTYLNHSRRTQATFAGKREEIYALFEAYLKMKRDRGEYDAADRTHAILRSVAQDGIKGQRIDFLYVDEVQDNLLIDAKILRAICCNPNGQFWAGDTAQTISVGSSFRFGDLKAFLYRNEESLRQQSAGMIASRSPKSFQLVTNFRSHGGIVKCAHSIIALIMRFWPYMIDILPQEKGIVDGIKPVFFSGWDQDNVRYESFLFGTAGHHIEFGAQQCILVRNDEAREKLRAEVGDVGLIMTLYESKGLEFNDVLLYNFFEDSSADATQWRVVLNAIDYAQIPAPTFDENRHAGVCPELKFLYVAITRARKNLWIFDRSQTAEPMQVSTDVPPLAVSSSPEEWSKMAKTLFSHKRYFQAMHSYERAGMPREKAIAYAYYLREQARGIPVRSRAGDNGRRNAYEKVAEVFLASAGESGATSRERSEYYRIAAETFLILEDYAQAARAFEKASNFTEAAQNYRHAGMFDQTVSVIQNHGAVIDLSVAKKLTDVARYYYLERGDLKKALSLFSNDEEVLEFVRDCGLDIAEVRILVERGKYTEAADLHIRENRMLDAVEVLLKDKNSKETIQRASQSLLGAFWNILSFGVLPLELDNESQANLKRMVRLVGQFDLSAVTERDQRELRMFSAIYENDMARLTDIGTEIFLSQDKNKPAALLCFDHSFRYMNKDTIFSGSDTQILNRTRALCDYAELVQDVHSALEPWSKERIQKLFSFTVHSGGQVCLRRGTFLHGCFEGETLRGKKLNQDAIVEVRFFYRLYQSSLRRRLNERLVAYCNFSLSVQVFEPCAFRRCDHPECQRHHDLDRKWFDKRLQFHMFQISILHSLRFCSFDPGQHRDLRRMWLERLYDVVNPAHYSFGSLTTATTNASRQMSRSFDLLKTFWIWPMLNELHLDRPWILSLFLRLVDLGSFLDSKALVGHVYRTCLARRHRPPQNMLDANHGYAIPRAVAFFHGEECGSIHAGALFTKHILSNNVPIEHTVLCRVLELVASSYIMASTFNRTRSFHGVTLPRSWILENMQKLNRVTNQGTDPGLRWDMMIQLRDLLEPIYSGNDSDHILHRNKPLHFAQFRVRNLALARLCRVICLLGFNIRNQPLRDLALESITSLRKKHDSREFSSLYSQYVYAEDWWQLATAVTSSVPPTPLDEMIMLIDINKNAPRVFRGVRIVKFRNADDLHRQFAMITGPASMMDPAATSFIPGQASLQTNSVNPPVDHDTNNGDSAHAAEEEEDAESHEEADDSAIIEPLGANFTEVSEEALAEQDSAARILQSYYRRLLTNRANRISNPGLGLTKTRKDQFEAFARAADSIEWPQRSLYRPIFLGALPHLLTCLDRTWTIVMEEKTKVKQQQRQNMSHQGIEKLMDRQTSLTKMGKRIQNVQTSLQASAPFHRFRDLKQLELFLEGVRGILDEIPQAKEELAFDMSMACAWMRYVNEKPKPTEVKKPVLNTDDLDGMY